MHSFRDRKLVAVHVEIGRGHPNYLDSVLRELRRRCRDLKSQAEVTSLFAVSRGLSRLGWKAIERGYRLGGQGGVISSTYSHLRKRSSGGAPLQAAFSLLVGDLRTALRGYGGLVLVSHPLLARLLGSEWRVFYIHGEIAVPAEAACLSAEKSFVPLECSRTQMLSLGLSPERVAVCGLMLEPELLITLPSAREERARRREQRVVPTFGFFTSGAYPREHIRQTLQAIEYLLQKTLGRVVLSTGNDTSMHARLVRRLSRWRPTPEAAAFARGDSALMILHEENRENLTLRELEMLPSLDVFAAAAHERTNWAAGYGLPFIVLLPNIGSYAPLNFEFIRSQAEVYWSEEQDVRTCIDRFLNLNEDFVNSAVRDSGIPPVPVDGVSQVASEIITVAGLNCV